MSNSVRPQRQQPTRLRRPWDSPGKNTGVGCHFLLQCVKVKSESGVAQLGLDSSRPHGLQPTRLLRPWDFPGKSTGVGCHCLLQALKSLEIFAIHPSALPRVIRGPMQYSSLTAFWWGNSVSARFSNSVLLFQWSWQRSGGGSLGGEGLGEPFFLP